METSNDYNSGTFKDRAKMFAPKRGFGNLMVSLKFVSDGPLLPWQPTDSFWTQNWLQLRLYKMHPINLHQPGGFRGRAI